MANLGVAFRQEIVRLSRVEARSELAGIRKTIAALRTELQGTKRRLFILERAARDLGQTTKGLQKVVQPNVPQDFHSIPRVEFIGIRRSKGLSQEAAALLMAVSPQTIYNWERKKGNGVPARGDIHKRVRHLEAMSKEDVLAVVKSIKAKASRKAPVYRSRKR